MMTAIVRCPNAACGRVSHLGDDPLGRIFRCPRCLTKLPSAPASAADSGWTAVVGPPRLGEGRMGFRSIQAQRWVQPALAAAAGRTWNSSALGSSQVVVGSFDMDCECASDHDLRSHSGLGPDDSGEVLIEPFSADGKSDSAWGATSMSSVASAVADRSTSGLIGTNLVPAVESRLGRFRILSFLGKGSTPRSIARTIRLWSVTWPSRYPAKAY
jgi:hypothetical protein